MTKKTAILCTIAIILNFYFNISAVFPYDEWDAETVSVVNMRESSATDGRVISTLAKNYPVMVIGEYGNWYNIKIQVGDTQVSGWVFNEYLRKINPAEQLRTEVTKPTKINDETDTIIKPSDQAHAVLPFKGKTIATVNMRKAPQINAGVITSVPAAQELTVIEEVAQWYKAYLETDDYSMTGWINSSFIKAEMKPEVSVEKAETPPKAAQLSSNAAEGVVVQTNNPAVSADATQKNDSASSPKEGMEQTEKDKENPALNESAENSDSEAETSIKEDGIQKIIETESTSPVIPPDMEAGTMAQLKTEKEEKSIMGVFATIIINLICALFSCIALLCSIKALNTAKALMAVLNEFKDEK